MRILFQYFSGGGGGLSNIILLLRMLAKLYPQDQIVVVCSPDSELSCLSVLPNIEVVFYGGSRHKEVDRLLLGYFGLKKIVKKYQVDVAWSLNVGSYVNLSVPHVLSVNNAYQVYPLDDVAQYHPRSRFSLIFLRAFFQKTLRHSNAVILQTNLMQEYVQEINGAPKSYVVSKAVERDEDVTVEPLPLEISSVLDQKKVAYNFLFVATNSPHKNYKLLIEAFGILAKRAVNVRVILTISEEDAIRLGGGNAKSLIDSGYVVPLGWVKKQHLRSLYQAADACLMPSLLESLSSAHLEAMQWGKPQIVADLPFSRDLCGDAAIYAPVTDSEVWAESIERLMSDDALKSRLIKQGYERMALFPKTWDDVALRVHKIFENMVVNT